MEQEKPKHAGGRPTTCKKAVTITARITPAQKEKLEAYAEKHNLSNSEAIGHAIEKLK